MSVQKRVKPSTRMKAAIKAKRRQVYAGVLACMMVVIVCLSGYLIYDKMIAPNGVSADILATRTMLSKKTSYNGSWITQADGLFEVYLPGTVDTSKEWQSLAVSAVHNNDYDNAIQRAFGVVYSPEKLDITTPSEDPMIILDSVSSMITNDVAAVCLGGRPSVAYDVEVVTMQDGTEAVKISGDIEVTLIMQKSKTDTETYEEQMVYPVIAYVTLQKGYPVGAWCVYDPFDYFASEEVPAQLEEMVSTIWQTKFTGEDVEWVEVPTTLDENRRIIFPEDFNNGNSSEEDDGGHDPSEPDAGSPSWTGTPPQTAHSHGEGGEIIHPDGEVISPEGDVTLPEGAEELPVD